MKTITILSLLSIAIGLIGWDIYVYIHGTTPDMISGVIWDTSRDHPVMPFLFGVLMGHFFWVRKV